MKLLCGTKILREFNFTDRWFFFCILGELILSSAIVKYWFFLLGINFCDFQEVAFIKFSKYMQSTTETICRDVKRGNFIILFLNKIIHYMWRPVKGDVCMYNFPSGINFLRIVEKPQKLEPAKNFVPHGITVMKPPLINLTPLVSLVTVLKNSTSCWNTRLRGFHSFIYRYLNIVTLTFSITNSVKYFTFCTITLRSKFKFSFFTHTYIVKRSCLNIKQIHLVWSCSPDHSVLWSADITRIHFMLKGKKTIFQGTSFICNTFCFRNKKRAVVLSTSSHVEQYIPMLFAIFVCSILTGNEDHSACDKQEIRHALNLVTVGILARAVWCTLSLLSRQVVAWLKCYNCFVFYLWFTDVLNGIALTCRRDTFATERPSCRCLVQRPLKLFENL